MSHILSHTIKRGGSFVYNRRVPKSAQDGFGCSNVRIHLGTDEALSAELSERLTAKLDELWASPVVRPVNLHKLMERITPRVVTLEDALGGYLEDRAGDRSREFGKVTRLAHAVLAEVAGNKDIEAYDREDARAFMRALMERGVKTATVRRRLSSICAIFEHAYYEGGISGRNLGDLRRSRTAFRTATRPGCDRAGRKAFTSRRRPDRIHRFHA